MDGSSLFASTIAGVFIIAGAFIVGVPMIAFGQLLSVFREIALNTRRDEGPITTQYRMLEILAALIGIIGWIIIVGGILLGAASFIPSLL